MKKLLTSILLIVVPLGIIIFSSIFIFRLGSLSGLFSGVLFIAEALNQYTGLNIWLARLIAVPFLTFGYYYGIRYIIFQRNKKEIGYLSLIIVWSVLCAAQHIITLADGANIGVLDSHKNWIQPISYKNGRHEIITQYNDDYTVVLSGNGHAEVTVYIPAR